MNNIISFSTCSLLVFMKNVYFSTGRGRRMFTGRRHRSPCSVYIGSTILFVQMTLAFDLKHLQQVFPVKNVNHTRGKQRGVMIIWLPGADPEFAVRFSQIFKKNKNFMKSRKFWSGEGRFVARATLPRFLNAFNHFRS